jgi:regulator of nucleoside diphosphate kinase
MNAKTIHLSTQIRPSLTIDARHYARLLALAEKMRKQEPEVAEQLIEEIDRADLCPSDEMPDDVVTIGSTVTFRDGAQTHTVQIVLPSDADIDRRRVSVIAPVGTALLGLSEGQRITWEMPGGRTREIEVLNVRRAS